MKSEELPWFALCVRARRESWVVTHLEGKGYQCFLPTCLSPRQWSDRVRAIPCPLFPGYVFCRIDLSQRLPLLTTPGLLYVVGAPSPISIPESEIENIRRAVESGLPVAPAPYLRVGQEVEVIKGPLTGVRGLLSEMRGGRRVVLSITLLQRSLAVEMAGEWLLPIVSGSAQRRPDRTAPAVLTGFSS